MIELVKTSVDQKDTAHERTSHARAGCDTCRFCGVMNAMDKNLTLVCRRYPPKVALNLVLTQAGASWQTATGWPGVQKHEWCGEYVSDTAAA